MDKNKKIKIDDSYLEKKLNETEAKMAEAKRKLKEKKTKKSGK